MSDRPTQIVSVARQGGKHVDVEGSIVAPGLAITPSSEEGRFTLTHIPSGLAFVRSRCAEHIEIAAAMVATRPPIDWTRDTAALVADTAVTDLAREIVAAVGFCYGCGEKRPEGPSWSVRCDTCHWQWEDEDAEGPLDAKEAKRLARDHECDPDVQISPSGDSNEWFAEWLVNDDGTIGRAREVASGRPAVSP